MINLTELKTYLKITDASQDNQLNLAIQNAKGFLKSYLGYNLELDASRIALFYGYDTEFELKFTNINGVSSIKYADDEFNPTWINYDTSTDFKVFLERGLVKTRDTIGPITEIVYSFGYDDTTCPDELKAALLEIAAMSFKNMGEVSMGDLKSETVDGDSVTFKDITGKLSSNVLILLDKYKQYGFSA